MAIPKVTPAWRWTIPIFLIVATIHILSHVKMPGDGRWVLHTSMSILADGDIDLSEYNLEPDQRDLVWINGKPYNRFPVGASIWSLPVVFLLDTAMSLFSDNNYQDELMAGHHSDIQEICASLSIATTAVLLWFIAGILGLTRRQSLLLVMFFAFGTSAWSAGSRALFAHGPSLVFLSLAILSLFKAEIQPRWLYIAGVALAMAFVTRPTNAISVIGLSIYCIWRFRQDSWRLILLGGAGAVLFAWHSFSVYGTYLPPYFQPTRVAGSTTTMTALAGNLISPNRGLFVFTPALLFSLFGLHQWQKESRWRALINVLAGIVVAHWLVISQFDHWWAGWCYGPRFFTDMLVYFSIFLIPVIRHLDFKKSFASRSFACAFIVAMLMGGLIHWRGANCDGTMEWNATPTNIDASPDRVWDWKDPQIFRKQHSAPHN